MGRGSKSEFGGITPQEKISTLFAGVGLNGKKKKGVFFPRTSASRQGGKELDPLGEPKGGGGGTSTLEGVLAFSTKSKVIGRDVMVKKEGMGTVHSSTQG